MKDVEAHEGVMHLPTTVGRYGTVGFSFNVHIKSWNRDYPVWDLSSNVSEWIMLSKLDYKAFRDRITSQASARHGRPTDEVLMGVTVENNKKHAPCPSKIFKKNN